MEHQLTLRIPRNMATRLDACAKAARIKRSQVVRDALDAYLGTEPAPDKRSVKERLAPYVGALAISPKAVARDDFARTIRAHNWRA